ncbi:hypothetical protein BDY24DRAFT_141816 [Mrakia frigida]|uniref:putative endodeoxyribonuclease n=1 Tax=Mrakia frigida TaxID=29902 RepID=UPI003FCC21D3
MSTNEDDQELVKHLAKEGGGRVVPSFGYHPWYTFQITLLSLPLPSKHDHYTHLFFPSSSSDSTPPNQQDHQLLLDLLPFLPEPLPLSNLLRTLKENLLSHPTSLLGECGLDKRARVPFPPSYLESLPLSHQQGHPKFTHFTTPLEHQVAVLTAQMEVLEEVIVESNELDEGEDGVVRNGKSRRVSLHAVGCAGVLGGLLDEWEREIWDGKRRWRREVKVCVHSCGLSAESWNQIARKHPSNLYLSCSPLVLHEPSPSCHSPLNAPPGSELSFLPTLPPLFTTSCSPDRILVESDSPDLRWSEEGIWKVVRALARGRGWEVEETWPTREEREKEEEGRVKGVVERLEENWERWMGDES